MRLQQLSLPLLLLAIGAQLRCTSDENSSDKRDSTEGYSVIPGQSAQNIPGIDPYFVESKDTASPYGPTNITRDVVQDKNGNIWLATWQGLFMYRDNVFTNITLKEGLLHNRFFCMLEDKNGILWFGTQGAGVYRYDPDAEIRTSGSTYERISTKDGLLSDFIECIFEDKAGNIWFGTRDGLSRYDDKTFLNINGGQELTGVVHAISQDKSGSIWIGSDDGVFLYDDKKINPFLLHEGVAFTNVRDIERDSKGVMWIASENGLHQCKLDSDGKKQLTSVRPNFTSYIREDAKGNLLLSASGYNVMTQASSGMELSKYDGTNFTSITHTNDLDGGQIFGVTVDDLGNIWFGTTSGVCCYDGNTIISFSK